MSSLTFTLGVCVIVSLYLHSLAHLSPVSQRKGSLTMQSIKCATTLSKRTKDCVIERKRREKRGTKRDKRARKLMHERLRWVRRERGLQPSFLRWNHQVSCYIQCLSPKPFTISFFLSSVYYTISSFGEIKREEREGGVEDKKITCTEREEGDKKEMMTTVMMMREEQEGEE